MTKTTTSGSSWQDGVVSSSSPLHTTTSPATMIRSHHHSRRKLHVGTTTARQLVIAIAAFLLGWNASTIFSSTSTTTKRTTSGPGVVPEKVYSLDSSQIAGAGAGAATNNQQLRLLINNDKNVQKNNSSQTSELQQHPSITTITTMERMKQQIHDLKQQLQHQQTLQQKNQNCSCPPPPQPGIATPQLHGGDVAKIKMKQRRRRQQQEETIQQHQQPLPSTFQNVFEGMSLVNRDDFIHQFDVGVPFLSSKNGNEHVLILHGHRSPHSLFIKRRTSSDDNKNHPNTNDTNHSIPLVSVLQATQHCLSMKIVLETPFQEDHCMAIVGQHESHILHKYLRALPVTDFRSQELEKERMAMPATSFDYPLRLVSRSQDRNEHFHFEYPLPFQGTVDAGRAFAMNYLQHLHPTLERLQPIAQRVGRTATTGTDQQQQQQQQQYRKYNNTIIVMMCNYGQVELLMNFVCSAHNRGLDTSQVLVFATDYDTYVLANALGITAFYDDKIFGEMPTNAANDFGDWIFMRLILAKVHCMHLISQLQYNILFQDVDMIWFRHPLDYFFPPNDSNKTNINHSLEDFDIYLQDNGSRHSNGEPYHPNLGFFFARYNDRTSFLFHSLVQRPDLVLVLDEQVTVSMMLIEQASFTGLRAKILPGDDFPGGRHFHHEKEYMKQLLQEQITPYVFHMSWTGHKQEKDQYLDQLGYKFISSQCRAQIQSKTILTNLNNTNNTQGSNSSSLVKSCCQVHPVITCHYRDKPSKLSCNHTAPKDEGEPSFW